MVRVARWLLPLGVCLLGVPSAPRTALAAVGDPVDSGGVVIVDGENPDRPLERGTATSAFRVLLPSGATCPGDSLHDQWRLQSFMVPKGTKIGDLRYGGIGPEGTDQFALFTADAAQHSYNNELLPPSPAGGVEVALPALPVLSFEAVSSVPLSEGEYSIGVACTYFGATARYWDTPIIVSGSSVGRSADFRWRLATAPDVARNAESSPIWVALAAAAFIVALIGAVVLHRRRRGLHPAPSHTHPLRQKEHT